MKPLITFLFLAFSYPAFSQISFFKQINDVEEGSYPANFTEFMGEVYFTVRTIDGNRLWKTDGTEGGTVQVTNFNLSPYFSFGSPIPLLNSKILFVCGDYLYFQIIGELSLSEVWKTNGNSFEKVDKLFSVPQFCLNNFAIMQTQYAGALKEIEFMYYPTVEIRQQQPVVKKTMADFLGILSEKDYQSLKNHTEKARQEWNRDI